MLTGCAVGTSVDNLLKPPQLSVEQEQIYQALQNAVGNNITLQYPRSGDNLSAFIVCDMDDDGEDEAMVFYKKTGLTTAENNLRLNVLDQIDDGWMSVCDRPADGGEIERVMISRLGDAPENCILIGYSLVDQSARSLTVYAYQNGSLDVRLSESYAMFDRYDLNQDGTKELLILQSAGANTPAKAAVYRPSAEGAYIKSELSFHSNFTEFSQILFGTPESKQDPVPIFVDGAAGATTLQTEILQYQSGTLQAVLDKEEDIAATNRSVGYLTMDIDQDGIPEIPVQRTFPGYEQTASDQVRMTCWLTASENTLVQKYQGYFNLGEGVAFMLPMQWIDTVTAAVDSLTGDVVFYAYQAGAEDVTSGAELLRIGVAEDTDARDSRLDDGYTLLHSKGKAYYLMKVPDSIDSPLAMTQEELFYYILFV